MTANEEMRQERWTIAVGAVASIVSILPFWLVATIPALDHPAHFARMQILTDALAGRLASPFWRVDFHLVPNLAIDLVVPPLALVLGVDLAFRIVISIIALLPVVGAALLQRALFGRVTPTIVLATAMVFNWPLVLGFYNAAAGGGLLLVALAVWIRMAERRGARLVAMTAMTSLVWLCHGLPFLLLGLAIGLYELSRAVRSRDLAPTRLAARALEIALPFLPGLVGLALAYSVPSSAPLDFMPIGRRLGFILGAADDGTFAASPIVLLPLVVTLALVAAMALRLMPRVVVPHPDAGWIAAAFLVLALTAPLSVGNGAFVPLRLSAIFWFCCAGVFRFAGSPRLAAGVLALGLAITAGQAWQVTGNWRAEQVDLAAFRRTVADVVPRGSRILPVQSSEGATALRRSHWVDYAVTDIGAFTPTFFALPGLQIVRRTPAVEAIGAAFTHEDGPADADWLMRADDAFDRLAPELRRSRPWLAGWSCHFDVVVHLRDDEPSLPADPRLERLSSTPGLDIWRIRPAAHCPARG